MSYNKENVIQKAVQEFTDALQSELPLEHFSQYYDQLHFDQLTKQKSREILGNIQANSELDVEEAVAVAYELLPKFQQLIREWKAKNEENKVQCEHFLQNQVDFLLSDFRTSVVIKLVSASDVGLEDLETFLEDKKIVLIGILEKLSKPGEPHSSVTMKTSLNEKLDCEKMATLERQRLHLEQKAIDKTKKVLEDSKRIILEIASKVQYELKTYQGKDAKDLLKGKLAEINCYLSVKGSGKVLEECHPQVFSAILRTTAEVRKCMDEIDYKDMSAEEFADTLHDQLLYDFAGDNQIDGNAMDMTMPQQCEHNGLQIHFSEEEDGIKVEEEDEDLDGSERNARNFNNEAAIINSRDNEKNLEVDELEIEMEQSQSTGIAGYHSERCLVKPSMSKRKASGMNKSPAGKRCNRRSARLQKSSNSVTTNPSKRKRRFVVKDTKITMDDDDEYAESCGGEDGVSPPDNSDEEEILSSRKRLKACSNKPNGSRLWQSGKGRLNDDQYKPSADKITYLHLRSGIPIYRCNVCNRKCRQNMLKYHGLFCACGKRDDPLACAECGKRFSTKSDLKKHSRIHTEERPFKCTKCPERFNRKDNLQQHVRTHDSVGYRFHCNACKLSFISRQRLHDHNNRLHKEKLRFGCRYCADRFPRMDNLKSHVITHAGLRPFGCPICDRAATFKKYFLALHIERIHSQPRQAARKLANEAAIAYLVKETKDDSYRDMPEDKINSAVYSYVYKKANLKLSKGDTRERKSSGSTDNDDDD